jgi:tetratricopeptide (TPR) repeat protein
MTTEAPAGRERNFVRGILPWVMAAAGLGLYLLTINRWVTLASLPVAAKITGWDWRPAMFQPVFYLVTSPLRLLPEGWVPLALNLLTAVFAALTLALLARAVALLPHDRLPLQRAVEHSDHSLLSIPAAWLPPVLAVLVCGLQVGFWQHAVVATGEMLDLLLLAYITRCLLEYRISLSPSWLNKAALVFGLGMANAWTFWGLALLFLAALIWLKGVRFFDTRFLLQIALCGLAGLSIYLVWPILQNLISDAPVPIGQELRHVLGTQFGVAQFLFRRFNDNRHVALIVALTSLLPLLVLCLRWRSHSGDQTAAGSSISTLTAYFIHAFFLVACVWAAFGPSFSPHQAGRKLGLELPFLSLYFIGALCAGYYSGFFLLVCGRRPRGMRVRTTPTSNLLRQAAQAAVWALVVLVPAGLLYLNWPTIRAGDLPLLRTYANQVVSSLPPQGAIVLADDSNRLLLLHAALERAGTSERFLLLDSQALPFAENRAHIQRRNRSFAPLQSPTAGAGFWTNTALLDSVALIRMLDSLSRSNEFYYLHPSFGYYFEQWYAVPRGGAYQMLKYPREALGPPPLSAQDIQANEAFWRSAMPTVQEVLQIVSGPDRRRRDLRRRLTDWLRVMPEPPGPALAVANWYSIALDFWGVQLQRNGRLPDAADRFQKALELKPNSIAAEANLKSNTHLLAGASVPFENPDAVEDRRFGRYRTWQEAVAECGPFDEPAFCYKLGLVLGHGGLYRQAGQQFERVIALVPQSNSIPARLMLAQLYGVWQQPDRVLEHIREIRALPAFPAQEAAARADVAFLEASAYLAKTNFPQADVIIQTVLLTRPDDPQLPSRAAVIYTSHQRWTNALAMLDRQLRLVPDDVGALINRGYLFIKLGEFTNALPPLTRALSIETNNVQARFNRAVAYLRAEKLDEAQADYQQLLKLAPGAGQIYYGLGEIAYRKRDTNAALRYYQSYLTDCLPNSEQAQFATARLKELKPGTP